MRATAPIVLSKRVACGAHVAMNSWSGRPLAVVLPAQPDVRAAWYLGRDAGLQLWEAAVQRVRLGVTVRQQRARGQERPVARRQKGWHRVERHRERGGIRGRRRGCAQLLLLLLPKLELFLKAGARVWLCQLATGTCQSAPAPARAVAPTYSFRYALCCATFLASSTFRGLGLSVASGAASACDRQRHRKGPLASRQHGASLHSLVQPAGVPAAGTRTG